MRIFSLSISLTCLLVAVLLVAVTTTALAQGLTEDQAERRAAIQEQIQQNQETRTENAAEGQEMREERRAALAENAQKRIINLAANISNKIEAAIKRLENIVIRLDSRSDKLKERGVDTSEADMYLAEAQGSLINAKQKMNDIDTNVYSTVTSENPREAWQQVKATYRSVHQDILDARESLRAAVTAMKAAITAAESGRGVRDAVTNDEALEEESELAE